MTNYDEKTGIYYGVISQHSLDGDALNEIYNGTDLDYEYAKEELKKDFVAFLESHDLISSWMDVKNQAEINDMFDPIEERFNEQYESDSPTMRYEEDGYIIETSETDLFIIKSPYVTYAPPCSPCAPDAGNLDDAGRVYGQWMDQKREDGELSADNIINVMRRIGNSMGNARLSYCLGKDWFENEKAPYPYALWSSDEAELDWIFPE
jgi:hypothetical protein